MRHDGEIYLSMNDEPMGEIEKGDYFVLFNDDAIILPLKPNRPFRKTAFLEIDHVVYLLDVTDVLLKDKHDKI